MRIGIIADLHGNLPALQAIIDAIGKDVDTWICAGDIAGHLPFVDETAALLQHLGARCVKGNHDEALVNDLAIPSSSAATRTLQLQRSYVSNDTKSWLADLPSRLDFNNEGQSFTVVHGGPNDPLYEKVDTITDDVRTAARGRVFIFGHSHKAMDEVSSEHIIINPGSAGMPVGGAVVAHASVLSLPEGRIERVQVPYAVNTLTHRMTELGYDERYFNCLKHGRWVGFSGQPPKQQLIIAGASIYGEMIAELIAASSSLHLAGFVDDSEQLQGKTLAGALVLGRVSNLKAISTEAGVTDVAVALGDNVPRRRVSSIVKSQGVRLATLVHPSAIVSPTARLSPGTLIDAQSYIGPYCAIGEGVSIWPHVTVSHHTSIGAYAALKARVVVGGHSNIAAEIKIDLGTVVPSYSQI
jgi:putative phosphoesterase